MSRIRSAVCVLLIIALFCGCSVSPPSESSVTASASGGSGQKYTAPAFADSKFDETKASGQDGVLIDTSETSLGYVAVNADTGGKLKFQIVSDSATYNYDLPSDGTPVSYVLQSGDGTYNFRVMKNTSGDQYAEVYSRQENVTLQDEFQPFLRPSQYVDYNEDSQCVKLAASLAGGAEDELGVVRAVYDYVCNNVKYDTEKAQTVKSGYLPSPDGTLADGKGICFDYAALAAAMLRSQGIPTKVIFGYVSPDNIFHAWNMFYTEESGWVTVNFEVDSSTWSRLDLTFSANGADGTFVGDGTNYTDLYIY